MTPDPTDVQRSIRRHPAAMTDQQVVRLVAAIHYRPPCGRLADRLLAVYDDASFDAPKMPLRMRVGTRLDERAHHVLNRWADRNADRLLGPASRWPKKWRKP